MKFYSQKEVADILSVSVATVRRYIREGVNGRRLAAVRIGGTGVPRIDEDDLMLFMGKKPQAEVERSGHRKETTWELMERIGRLHGQRGKK